MVGLFVNDEEGISRDTFYDTRLHVGTEDNSEIFSIASLRTAI
jgi:hypothetical protein